MFVAVLKGMEMNAIRTVLFKSLKQLTTLSEIEATALG